jgi:galactonate dehydratase
MYTRRKFLQTVALGVSAVSVGSVNPLYAAGLTISDKNLLVERLKVYEVKVNHRGNWFFVELITNKNIKGIGEASHAISYSNVGNSRLILNELNDFFGLVKGESPFDIEQYRQKGWQKAQTGKLSATAFSAIEQALWDIAGKAAGIPSYQFFGGKVRNKIRVYANINRATNKRDNNGRRLISDFRNNAELALKSGFNALKLAPFDEMKPLPSNPVQIRDDIDYAIRCIEEIRNIIGNETDLLIDVHSHLNQSLGIETAKQLEPFNLFWFEEPVNPSENILDMKAITVSTKKQTAGGESIFGRKGFYPLITEKAVNILMPDVKHCGGVQELKHIAVLADTAGIDISPHNPSGPVSTAVNVALCAHIPNFSILEYAQGEVEWREKLITPVEKVDKGYIHVNDRPGWGYELNYSEINKQL